MAFLIPLALGGGRHLRDTLLRGTGGVGSASVRKLDSAWSEFSLRDVNDAFRQLPRFGFAAGLEDVNHSCMEP
jgi:hypothetical protein